MKKTPRISETEWEVMKVIWAEAPCTAGQIIELLTRADPTWHPKTVKAFLNRLVKKRVLGFRKEGRAYLYRPLVREGECVDAGERVVPGTGVRGLAQADAGALRGAQEALGGGG